MSVSKSILRESVRAKLAGLTAQERLAASGRACDLLQRQPVWRHSHAVLFFAPLPGELDIWPLLAAAIAAGKVVALPKFAPQSHSYTACRVRDVPLDVVPGHLNIREPRPQCPEVPLNRLDFVLVPGVAFDLRGRRLGRGKGFYDRLLSAVTGSKCGVAFDEQIVHDVPIEPHDVHLDCILTPTRWIEPQAARGFE